MPAAPAEAAPQGTEHVVEETIRDLKTIPGFQSYLILNNDGIVIKYENMSYRTAVHYSHQVLGLASKATKYIRDLFDAPDNEVESIRLRRVSKEGCSQGSSLSIFVFFLRGVFPIIVFGAC